LIFLVAGTVIPLALAAAGWLSTFVIKIARRCQRPSEEHEHFRHIREDRLSRGESKNFRRY
jgi:hypothetical protein